MPTAIPVLLSHAEVLYRSGSRDEALSLATELSATADRTKIPLVEAVAARTMALCDPENAEAHLDEANRLHGLAGDGFEQARSWLITGELLRRSRRNVEARGPLRAALTTFRRLQAEPWAHRASSELRAAGAEDPAALQQDESIATLTPRELRVALAVAEGGTNRDVAATLFISAKTVEYHLGKIFRKLDVKSRTELASLLARLAVADAGVHPAAPQDED